MMLSSAQAAAKKINNNDVQALSWSDFQAAVRQDKWTWRSLFLDFVNVMPVENPLFWGGESKVQKWT